MTNKKNEKTCKVMHRGKKANRNKHTRKNATVANMTEERSTGLRLV